MIVPNGVLVPPHADPANRETAIVFIGGTSRARACTVLLRAWPEIHRRTGARLRLVGADPLAVRLVLTRERVPTTGIDVLGVLTNEELTDELLRAKVQVASSLGGESFGMVLTRGLACAVRSSRRTSRLSRGARGRRRRARSRRRPRALADAVVGAARRRGARAGGAARARALAQERYAWDGIAARLLEIYEELPRERRVLRSPWLRVAVVLVAAIGVAVASGGAGRVADVSDAFTACAGAGSSRDRLNLLSVVARSLAWRTVINQAVPPPQPAYRLVFAAFSVGLFANAVLPGASASSRASRC
jgi:hypothetical protein